MSYLKNLSEKHCGVTEGHIKVVHKVSKTQHQNPEFGKYIFIAPTCTATIIILDFTCSR
jgi:hypothetical protein